MDENTLYLMTLYKEGKRIGLEISETIETLTGRAQNCKDIGHDVKFWECKEIKKINKEE